MIGIVVVTHVGLAEEVRNATELILGPLEKVAAISISRDMSVEHARTLLEETIGTVGSDGEGVLILTDLFGGTPTNISAEFLAPGKVDILTGVNMPMLIKAATARTGHDLDGLASMLKAYAQNAIMRPMELLNP